MWNHFATVIFQVANKKKIRLRQPFSREQNYTNHTKKANQQKEFPTRGTTHGMMLNLVDAKVAK